MAGYNNGKRVDFTLGNKRITGAAIVERLGKWEVAFAGRLTDAMRGVAKVAIGGRLYSVDKIENSPHVTGMVRMEVTDLTDGANAGRALGA